MTTTVDEDTTSDTPDYGDRYKHATRPYDARLQLLHEEFETGESLRWPDRQTQVWTQRIAPEPTPISPTHPDIISAQFDIRQWIKREVSGATAITTRCSSEYLIAEDEDEDAREIVRLAFSLPGIDRRKRAELNDKVIDLLDASESDVVRERLSVVIR